MREPPGLRADRGIVVRTPLLPIETLTAWAAAGDLAAQRRFLTELFARDEVREALFVASPSLFDALERWAREPAAPGSRAAERSLVKYVARMAGRATPFGLFSGVTPGTLGRETALELGPLAGYRRRTRIDNDYLFALADAISRDPEARARLGLRPNSSLYEVADRLRYASARLEGQNRTYHLVSVEPTPYLRATLARAASGARRAELAEALVRDFEDAGDPDGIELAEALAYVDELIEAQLLIPELGISITGTEPIDALADQLAAAGLAGPRDALLAVRGELADLDRGLGNPPARYRDVAARLEALPAKAELSRLFQVDMVKPGAPALGVGVAAEVARAIEWLQRTTRRNEDTSLDDFRRGFLERYEGRTVPLAEVLDEETGIGFETSRAPGAEGAPLLAGLPFPGAPRTERVPWGPREAHLLRRLAAALAAGARELVLDDADARALAAASPAPGPDALAAMIRLGAPVGGADEPAILFEGAFGPSGARILGRFCHASPEIDAMVRAHLRAEEAQRPGAVFAEIVHLNEGRIGNILCRPVLRDHEIVYLGISGAPPERQLPIDDLLVGVRGERIVLTSRRLGREVVPRLSTAHNFRVRSLGFYRFLCALQNQRDEVTGGWSWGPLSGAPFLPRVRLGRVVLSRATWNLAAADLAPITAAVRAGDAAAIAAAVAALRARVELPRWLALADGDNELPIDLDNPMLADALADELSGRSGAALVELFPAPGEAPVHGPEGHFANEIVLMFTRGRPAKTAATGAGKTAPVKAAAPAPAPAPAPPAPAAPPVRRLFTPASPWLFLKLYTGTGTADRILQAIAPVIRGALEAGDASHWFFLRYQDPGPHLRLRIAGEPERLVGAVLPAIERAAAPHLAAGAIWRLQVDTYEREVERYGGDAGIDTCERVFWIDSEAVLSIVELLEGDAGAVARWRLALRGADQLLEALGMDDATRGALFASARDNLGKEHHADAAFYARLGDRWKRERAELEALLARDPAADAAHEYAPALAILAERSARLAALQPAPRELPGWDGFAWSLVHMHVNRLLHASQRAQELVLYDFLRRWHESRRARRGAAP